MHSHGSDRAAYPLFSIRIAEHRFGRRGPAGCKRRDRRPSPAEAEPDHIRMPHTEDSMQTGHESLTVRLMNAIAQRLAKTCWIAGLNRSQEQREMLKIEHRIAQRQSRWQCPPRNGRGQLCIRRRDHDSPFRGPRPSGDGNGTVLPNATTRQATEERWRRVVGVPLNLCYSAQQVIGRTWSVDKLAKPQAGNGCGGAAAESASKRDLAAHINDQRGTSAPHRRE